MRPALHAILAAAACAAALGAGCRNYPYDPTKATRPYPVASKQERVADIQVIPDPGNGIITLVNPTAVSYRDFDLWVNRRYVRRVESLAAGESVTLQIDSFWDERGEGPFQGGWFRYYQPTPIVLVQAQVDAKSPLVGFICTLPEAVRER